MDNSAAAGVVNNTIVPCKLKAMDRRLHWLTSQNRLQKGLMEKLYMYTEDVTELDGCIYIPNS